MESKEQLAVTEYLHLYLGCEVQTINGTGILISVGDSGRGEDCVVSIQTNDEESGFYGEWTDYDFEHHKIKPILRPLSDMTEEEAQVLFRMYWGRDYEEDWSGDTGSAYFKPRRINPTKEHTMRIIEGLDYQTGDFLTVAKIVPRLLALGFDLFGLIPAGLAIDATTINNQNPKK
jgi:hypothetical protein